MALPDFPNGPEAGVQVQRQDRPRLASGAWKCLDIGHGRMAWVRPALEGGRPLGSEANACKYRVVTVGEAAGEQEAAVANPLQPPLEWKARVGT